MSKTKPAKWWSREFRSKTLYRRSYFDEGVEKPIHITELDIAKSPARRLARHADALAENMTGVKKPKKKKRPPSILGD